MMQRCSRKQHSKGRILWWCLSLALFSAGRSASAPKSLQPGTELSLRDVPFKIVYESYKETDGKQNWELMLVNADGSAPANLTKTGGVDEMYPHACDDGSKICFVADEGSGRDKVRSVYYMNIDGSGRVKVAHNARQPCWSPDGKKIAYLKAEYTRYTTRDYASKGVFVYDLDSSAHREHCNGKLHHLYNLCWSPDAKWFLATVHGGMGFKHAILAFPADGEEVSDLTKFGVTGCRPDLSPDGKMVTWGKTDWDLYVGKIDLSATPRVSKVHALVKCEKTHEVYHTDFSPDGRYIAFSYGPKAEEQVGRPAPGWNICVADLGGNWVQITTDGDHNKEPDWVPTPASGH